MLTNSTLHTAYHKTSTGTSQSCYDNFANTHFILIWSIPALAQIQYKHKKYDTTKAVKDQ